MGRPLPESRGQMMVTSFRAVASGGEKAGTDLRSVLELECIELAGGLDMENTKKGRSKEDSLGLLA